MISDFIINSFKKKYVNCNLFFYVLRHMFKLRLQYILVIFGLLFVQDSLAQSLHNSNIHYIQSNQKKLVNGVKISIDSNQNQLIKIIPSSIEKSVDSQDYSLVPSKNEKKIKPPKVLKYGIRKDGEEIKREDE